VTPRLNRLGVIVAPMRIGIQEVVAALKRIARQQM
jgi:hypothetical protein